MRFAVETWAPDYGSPTDEAALAATEEVVDAAAEVPVAEWAPRTPTGSAVAHPDAIAFVDGVRRVDARVWVTGADGDVRQGICATWAAGIVRCCGPEARLVRAEVRRGLFSPAGAESIDTRHGSWTHRPAASDDPDQLAIVLQNAMADLEHRVSEGAGAATAATPAIAAPDLLLVDGPLRERARIAGAVGYVKSHQRSYLAEGTEGIIGDLAAGQRTPLLHIGGRFSRWSWYLRLPGEVGHAWAGIVRCEASAALPVDEVVTLADRVSATLPRFASVPQKDPRAPQNLHPIAGLERELGRRLGDPLLLYRALREAAATAATASIAAA